MNDWMKSINGADWLIWGILMSFHLLNDIEGREGTTVTHSLEPLNKEGISHSNYSNPSRSRETTTQLSQHDSQAQPNEKEEKTFNFMKLKIKLTFKDIKMNKNWFPKTYVLYFIFQNTRSNHPLNNENTFRFHFGIFLRVHYRQTNHKQQAGKQRGHFWVLWFLCSSYLCLWILCFNFRKIAFTKT